MGIIADGAALEWKVDGVRICSVTETSCREGSIAHYTWDNWGIYVDDIVVADLDTNVVCLSADLEDSSLTDWTIVKDGKAGLARL